MKFSCSFVFKIMNNIVANFSSYGNSRNKKPINIKPGTSLLPLETGQAAAFELPLPQRQDPEPSGLLQNPHGILF